MLNFIFSNHHSCWVDLHCIAHWVDLHYTVHCHTKGFLFVTIRHFYGFTSCKKKVWRGISWFPLGHILCIHFILISLCIVFEIIHLEFHNSIFQWKVCINDLKHQSVCNAIFKTHRTCL